MVSGRLRPRRQGSLPSIAATRRLTSISAGEDLPRERRLAIAAPPYGLQL